MSFFGRLARALLGGGTGGGRHDDGAGGNAFWLYVKCSHCGEKIRVRVSREHDLSAEFEGGDFPSAYYVHKEIIGNSCFRRIKVDLYFDGRRQLSQQKIDGGTFISAEEYQAPSLTPGPGATDAPSG
jgi:hypothetical protein